MPGYSRKNIVIGVYIPPGYTQKEELFPWITLRRRSSRKFQDPFNVAAGIFNKWKMEETLWEFTDITEVLLGPTRNDKSIDKLFTNITYKSR